MAVSTKDIIDEVADLLIDSDFGFWGSDEHLVNLNEGMTQIALLKPDASVTASEYQLTEGVRQSLPDGSASFQDASAATLPKATKLVRVVMNMGTDGQTPGRGISIIDLDLMVQTDPSWAVGGEAAEAIHYTYDEKDPKAFWVYPPQPSSNQGYVFVVYNSIPPACAAYDAGEDIPLSDEYRQALVFFMLFRAYSKNTDTADANKALQYYDAFKTALGTHNNMERNEDPNVKDTVASPSYERR